MPSVKSSISACAAVLLVCLSQPAAQAIPISGDITFGGTAFLNTVSAGTATAVNSWAGFGGLGSPFVIDADGSFASVAPLTPVSIASSWSFNSGPVQGFWIVGGFTFDLTSSVIDSQTAATMFGPAPALKPLNGSVTVLGSGIISGNGFDSTYGTWTFTTQDPGTGTPNTRFSFSAASGASGIPVPEGSSSLALLGLALCGVETLRRKLAAV